MAERAALGDWGDIAAPEGEHKPAPTRGPMAARYSDARLRSSAEVRRIVLSAISSAKRRGHDEGEGPRSHAGEIAELRRDTSGWAPEPAREGSVS